MRMFLMAALALVPALVFADAQDEALWRHRTLGKAFYENPVTQYEAVGEFKKALDLAPNSARERVNYGLSMLRAGQVAEGIKELERAQQQDPAIPHTWFNLGIAYKRNSQYDKAIAQLEEMVRLAPREAIAHYNLGVLYKLEKKNDLAIAHFEKSAALDRNLAGPHFQLATAYRQMGRPDDAQKAMAEFRRIKAEQAGAAVAEDLEWSFYSEIYEVIEPVKGPVPAGTLAFESTRLMEGAAGFAVLDATGDGMPDVLAWTDGGMALFAHGRDRKICGLEALKGVTGLAAGDFDNDGLTDICVLTTSGPALYRHAGGGAFVRHEVLLPQRAFRQALWLDYDHDNDLDLFLLGVQSTLVRNNGAAGFSEVSFPFVPGEALAGAQFDMVADTQGMDLAVVYGNRPGVLYRDRLAGKYEAETATELTGTHILTQDFNNDGWTDVVVAGASDVRLLMNDQKEGLVLADGPTEAAGPMVFADFENRGVSDLATGRAVFRNLGRGAFGPAQRPAGFGPARAMGAADFNGDGRVDVVFVADGGALALLRNDTPGQHWLRVGLKGVRNPVLAPGAEIEIKAGVSYQKHIYRGLPLVFGLGAYAEADAVRITWPNGLIQNETRQAAGQAYVYEEAQRLSGSCPMVFAWNGEEFGFITDVLGVAPLGASAGEGAHFLADHDEYVHIPGTSLVPKDGKYEIRITGELREVVYLDAVRLIAVDHPEDVEIFTNEKFKAPPFPEFRLFGVEKRHDPVSARDHRGRDVLAKVLAKDETYPDGFSRDYVGVAELHHIELDFGDVALDGRAVLVLRGWVDWADGSTFLNVAQQNSGGLILPYLQVKNAEGQWVTAIEDMGLPAGKPKTIAVDLSDKFLSDARQVRIVTNLCLYWDEIFLGENPDAPEVRLSEVKPASANLRFRGFSEVVVHPERTQPERFLYHQLMPMHRWNWNPTPGMYTRFGDVRPLLHEIDDLLVVMGAGDEAQLAFDVLPDVAEGWRRDFLLFVDGWAKDGDANTAFSQTVEPLPYHGMPGYPYEAPHAFPATGVHNRYREVYNTRPALRLVRSLNEGMEMVEGKGDGGR